MSKTPTLPFIKTEHLELPDFAIGDFGTIQKAFASLLPTSDAEAIGKMEGGMALQLLRSAYVFGLRKGQSISAESVARSASGLAANRSASPSAQSLEGVAPVSQSALRPVSDSAPVYPHLTAYSALGGVEKNKFWNQHKAKIIEEMQAQQRQTRADEEAARKAALADGPHRQAWGKLSGVEQTKYWDQHKKQIMRNE